MFIYLVMIDVEMDVIFDVIEVVYNYYEEWVKDYVYNFMINEYQYKDFVGDEIEWVVCWFSVKMV